MRHPRYIAINILKQISGEGTPLWKIRRNVYREQWNPGWFWNGNIIPL